MLDNITTNLHIDIFPVKCMSSMVSSAAYVTLLDQLPDAGFVPQLDRISHETRTGMSPGL